MINHGFYNISPTLYHDFYSENCFEVVFMRLAGKVRLESNLDKNVSLDITSVPSNARFNLKQLGDSVKLSNLPNSELVVQTIATKNKSVEEFQFPIQVGMQIKVIGFKFIFSDVKIQYNTKNREL